MTSSVSAAPSPLADVGRRATVVVVGIPGALALVYFGGWAFGSVVAALSAVAVWELYRLAGAHGVRPLGWLGMPAAAALVLGAVVWPRFAVYAPVALGILAGVAFLAMLSALFTRTPGEHPLAVVAVTLFGAAYAGLFMASAPLLLGLPAERGWGGAEASRWMGLAVVTLPMAATWIGDAAAYFAGSSWGKRRLAPTISPKKTWVGLWAELVASALAGVGWMMAVRSTLPRMPLAGPAAGAILGVLLGGGAILGDLAESLFKREAGVKDSGTFFPGHGGVLDRLDALMFTFPLAYVLLALLGRFR
jgi:phosphatidate cytidylyltransferase